MTEKEILDATKDWTEERKFALVFNITRQLDDSSRFWIYYLGKTPSPNVKKETSELIKIYGKPLLHKVFRSIGNSQEASKFTISYITKACENAKEQERIAKEREHTDKQIAEAREKAKDIALITGEEIRAKPDIGDKGWRKGLLTDNLAKETKIIKEILNATEIG